MFDLGPATATLSGIVEGVRDDQLAGPTPSGEATVATLLDHVNGLSMAFTAAATKTFPPGGSQPPSADATQLPSDWRTRIPRQLRTARPGCSGRRCQCPKTRHRCIDYSG